MTKAGKRLLRDAKEALQHARGDRRSGVRVTRRIKRQIGRCAKTGRFLPLAVARKRKRTAIVQTIWVLVKRAGEKRLNPTAP